MTTSTFEIIDDGTIVKVRVPYGKGTYMALEFVNGKLKLFSGSLDLEQAEALAQGILAAVAQIRATPAASEQEG